MTQEERDAIIELLPEDMNIWEDDSELEAFPGRTRTWWAEALGHPTAHPGCCKTCGCATTCLHDAHHDALVSTILRELDNLGALKKPSWFDIALAVIGTLTLGTALVALLTWLFTAMYRKW